VGCCRPSAETDKLITLDQLYLLDSGAQFRWSITVDSTLQ